MTSVHSQNIMKKFVIIFIYDTDAVTIPASQKLSNDWNIKKFLDLYSVTQACRIVPCKVLFSSFVQLIRMPQTMRTPNFLLDILIMVYFAWVQWIISMTSPGPFRFIFCFCIIIPHSNKYHEWKSIDYMHANFHSYLLLQMGV